MNEQENLFNEFRELLKKSRRTPAATKEEKRSRGWAVSDFVAKELESLAATFGYQGRGKGSVASMLEAIAYGEIKLSR